MTFQEALEAYARRHNAEWIKRLETEGYTLHSFDVVHYPYWQSDSGTGFPEDTMVVCKKTKVGARGQKHTSKQELYSPHGNPIAFMQALFEESE